MIDLLIFEMTLHFYLLSYIKLFYLIFYLYSAIKNNIDINTMYIL